MDSRLNNNSSKISYFDTEMHQSEKLVKRADVTIGEKIYSVTVRVNPELVDQTGDLLDQQLARLINAIHPEEIIAHAGTTVAVGRAWVGEALLEKAQYVPLDFAPSLIHKVNKVALGSSGNTITASLEITKNLGKNTLNRMSVKDNGAVMIQRDFHEQGVLEQTCHRIPTVSVYQEILEKKREMLEQVDREALQLSVLAAEDYLDGEPPTIKNLLEAKNIEETKDLSYHLDTLKEGLSALIQLEMLDEQLGEIHTKLDLIDNRASDWQQTEEFRDILRAHEGEGMTKEEYAQIMESEYLPLPANMRTHECEGDVLIRCPVLTDYSNGFTDLMLLSQAEGEGGVKALNDRIDDLSGSVPSYNCRKKAAVDYAKEQVKDIASVQKTLAKRTQVVGDQFLQLLMQQMEHHDVTGDSFDLFHVGLLNQQSKSFDDTGFNKNEEVEMQDMAYIFNLMNGKNIIFSDEKGPLFTKDAIYLPEKYGNGQDSVTLKAIFTNISVQGSLSNETSKTQYYLNTLAKDALEKEDKAFDEIVFAEAFDEEKAADLIEWAKNQGYCTSFGCFGVKDRTTVVSQVWATKYHTEKLSSYKKGKMMLDAMQKTSIGDEITRQNVDWARSKQDGRTFHIKASKKEIVWVKDHFKLQMRRYAHYAAQAKGVFIDDKIDLKRKIKYLKQQ